MAHPRLTAILVLLAVAGATGGPVAAAGARFDPAFEELLRSAAGRGNKLLKLTAETIRDEGCRTRPLPFLRLIGSEVYPSTATPGMTINHRVSYALCPATPNTTLTGSLTKRLFSSEQLILDRSNPRYQFRPGTWADDDQIVIPMTAPKGRYSIEIEVTVGAITQHTEAEFSIE